MQNEQIIPIDIHSNKLLDWLISRRHCNRDWQSSILIIREKINNAIQDMPLVDEITQLLTGTYINYFHCIRIIELLKNTEAGSRNVFGQYSSKRMKDWQEIVKLYEKNNIYLAEAAQMLIRNVAYEVPSLKKHIAKCQQIQEECSKKCADYDKNAISLKDDYEAACKQLGIQGHNIRKELISLLDDLPEAFNEAAGSAKYLQNPRNYYVAFLIFTLKNSHIETHCLPLLKHIINKGNTTTYEWKTGEVPEIVEDTKLLIPIELDSEEVQDDQIDFGDLEAHIDSDHSSSTPNGDFVHISKNELPEDDATEINFGNEGEDINWDIRVDTSEITIDENHFKGGEKVARGMEALSVLDNKDSRNIFINELLELKSFLEQRLLEMSSEGDILSSNQFYGAPSLVQIQTAEDVKKMLTSVKVLVSQITNVKLQHLYLIRSSPQYIDRLVDSFKQKLALIGKMRQAQEAATLKQKEAAEEAKILHPKLELIIEKTRVLQKQIEEDISKRYKSRPVNIMGGINAM